MTIKWKLGIIGIIAIAAVIVTGALGALEIRNRMIEAKQAQLVDTVDMAVDLATHLQDDVGAGKMTRDEAIQSFRRTLHSMRYDKGNGYLFAYSMDGTVFANAGNPQKVGQNKINETDVAGNHHVRDMIETVDKHGDGFVTYFYNKPGHAKPVPKLSYVKGFAPWSILVGNGIYIDDVDEALKSILLQMGLVIVLVSVFTMGVSRTLSRSIAIPLESIRRKMEMLSKGDTAIELEEARRKDEVGDMARTVHVFKQNMIETDRMRREQEEIKKRAEAERKNTLHSMADRFEQGVGAVAHSVSSASTSMRTSAEHMADMVRDARSKAVAVAAAAQQASRNVETVAAASNELAAASTEIARQMAKAQSVANQATEDAKDTNELVLSLAESVSKIGAVVGLINDIASQTNLLALNATIEAARAGDAGKGFAVVAGEVKTLANQTAKATDEITAQITAVQQKTADAVCAIEKITKVITDMEEINSTVASAVQEQTAATAEIARNIVEASNGTAEVTSNIVMVEHATTESGDAAESIRTSSSDLTRQSDTLDQDVTEFLKLVRAG